ncbi:MAG: nucleotidyltransferase domain-containing protein [Sulfurospirillum sp.]|nr:nucleotidyltransferase domain-containing protein [Sulfurospirillum sp.]
MQIKDILENENIKECIVFGSRAKGNYKKGSDVDLAIKGDEKRLSYLLNEESNLIYYFDVCNIEQIKNQKLKEHIQRVGKYI